MQQAGSSAKRAASSPLSSYFDKKSRLGITEDEVLSLSGRLNQSVGLFPHATAAEVPAPVLALTFRDIASYLSEAGYASMIDKCWRSHQASVERISSFSPEEHLALASIWIEARDSGDWDRIVNHPLLQVKLSSEGSGGRTFRGYTRDPDDQVQATEKSWVHRFEGPAAETLWNHITGHFRPSDKKVYAHYASIVQSSGMGKSRTVDQLAMEHFVIPLNLRQADTTGYPPADHDVRDYLTAADSKDVAYDRASSFLEALFEHTANILRDIESLLDDVNLVTEFRSRMTKGQKMAGHNEFREKFYRQVLSKAEELRKQRSAQATDEAPSSPTAAKTSPDSTPTRSQDFPPNVAFRKLEGILDPTQPVSPSAKPTRAKLPPAKESTSSHSAPLVILAFDEAHTITQRHQSTDGEWSVFNEIRHALRRLNNAPLFSLFLSTSGKISQFTSATREDISKRVTEGRFDVIEPYTDLGFDHLARVIAVDGSWDLERLTEDRHMFSLGRPLFSTRYLEGSLSVKKKIIDFAASKLLHADYIPEKPSPDQVLACLSQRIPIEFNSTTYTQHEREKKQVEGHMRVCLKIDRTFETMTTTSSSEPILSEAAYFVMQKTSLNAPDALKSIMEGFSISKGDRGEFLVLLLLTLARDATVGPADEFGRPIGKRRCFGLVDFIYGKLFREQTGTSPLDQESLDTLNKLQKDFPNARLHFSHFVKVHQHKAIDLTRLLLLQGRGAAVLCANSQKAIDAINIFLMDGTKLTRGNAGLILYQVKNDSTFTSKPDPDDFNSMDPYKLHILKAGDPPVPIDMLDWNS